MLRSLIHTHKSSARFLTLLYGEMEAGDAHKPSVSKQFYHFCDTTNVLLAVFRAEAQVLIEALPDVISIQSVAGIPWHTRYSSRAMLTVVLYRTRQTWGCRTNRSWYLLENFRYSHEETSSYSFAKNNRRGVDRVPVSHTVHLESSSSADYLATLVSSAHMMGWYVTLVALCIPCTIAGNIFTSHLFHMSHLWQRPPVWLT